MRFCCSARPVSRRMRFLLAALYLLPAVLYTDQAWNSTRSGAVFKCWFLAALWWLVAAIWFWRLFGPESANKCRPADPALSIAPRPDGEGDRESGS